MYKTKHHQTSKTLKSILVTITIITCMILTGCHINQNSITEPTTQQTLVTEEIEESNADNLDMSDTAPEIIETESITENIENAENTDSTKETDMTEPTVEVIEPPMDITDDELVEVLTYIPNAIVDLKYSTTDNFTGEQIYEPDMPAMLRFGTIKKLMKVQEELQW